MISAALSQENQKSFLIKNIHIVENETRLININNKYFAQKNISTRNSTTSCEMGAINTKIYYPQILNYTESALSDKIIAIQFIRTPEPTTVSGVFLVYPNILVTFLDDFLDLKIDQQQSILKQITSYNISEYIEGDIVCNDMKSFNKNNLLLECSKKNFSDNQMLFIAVPYTINILSNIMEIQTQQLIVYNSTSSISSQDYLNCQRSILINENYLYRFCKASQFPLLKKTQEKNIISNLQSQILEEEDDDNDNNYDLNNMNLLNNNKITIQTDQKLKDVQQMFIATDLESNKSSVSNFFEVWKIQESKSNGQDNSPLLNFTFVSLIQNVTGQLENWNMAIQDITAHDSMVIVLDYNKGPFVFTMQNETCTFQFRLIGDDGNQQKYFSVKMNYYSDQNYLRSQEPLLLQLMTNQYIYEYLLTTSNLSESDLSSQNIYRKIYLPQLFKKNLVMLHNNDIIEEIQQYFNIDQMSEQQLEEFFEIYGNTYSDNQQTDFLGDSLQNQYVFGNFYVDEILFYIQLKNATNSIVALIARDELTPFLVKTFVSQSVNSFLMHYNIPGMFYNQGRSCIRILEYNNTQDTTMITTIPWTQFPILIINSSQINGNSQQPCQVFLKDDYDGSNINQLYFNVYLSQSNDTTIFAPDANKRIVFNDSYNQKNIQSYFFGPKQNILISQTPNQALEVDLMNSFTLETKPTTDTQQTTTDKVIYNKIIQLEQFVFLYIKQYQNLTTTYYICYSYQYASDFSEEYQQQNQNQDQKSQNDIPYCSMHASLILNYTINIAFIHQNFLVIFQKEQQNQIQILPFVYTGTVIANEICYQCFQDPQFVFNTSQQTFYQITHATKQDGSNINFIHIFQVPYVPEFLVIADNGYAYQFNPLKNFIKSQDSHINDSLLFTNFASYEYFDPSVLDYGFLFGKRSNQIEILVLDYYYSNCVLLVSTYQSQQNNIPLQAYMQFQRYDTSMKQNIQDNTDLINNISNSILISENFDFKIVRYKNQDFLKLVALNYDDNYIIEYAIINIKNPIYSRKYNLFSYTLSQSSQQQNFFVKNNIISVLTKNNTLLGFKINGNSLDNLQYFIQIPNNTDIIQIQTDNQEKNYQQSQLCYGQHSIETDQVLIQCYQDYILHANLLYQNFTQETKFQVTISSQNDLPVSYLTPDKIINADAINTEFDFQYQDTYLKPDKNYQSSLKQTDKNQDGSESSKAKDEEKQESKDPYNIYLIKDSSFTFNQTIYDGPVESYNLKAEEDISDKFQLLSFAEYNSNQSLNESINATLSNNFINDFQFFLDESSLRIIKSSGTFEEVYNISYKQMSVDHCTELFVDSYKSSIYKKYFLLMNCTSKAIQSILLVIANTTKSWDDSFQYIYQINFYNQLGDFININQIINFRAYQPLQNTQNETKVLFFLISKEADIISTNSQDTSISIYQAYTPSDFTSNSNSIIKLLDFKRCGHLTSMDFKKNYLFFNDIQLIQITNNIQTQQQINDQKNYSFHLFFNDKKYEFILAEICVDFIYNFTSVISFKYYDLFKQFSSYQDSQIYLTRSMILTSDNQTSQFNITTIVLAPNKIYNLIFTPPLNQLSQQLNLISFVVYKDYVGCRNMLDAPAMHFNADLLAVLCFNMEPFKSVNPKTQTESTAAIMKRQLYIKLYQQSNFSNNIIQNLNITQSVVQTIKLPDNINVLKLYFEKDIINSNHYLSILYGQMVLGQDKNSEDGENQIPENYSNEKSIQQITRLVYNANKYIVLKKREGANLDKSSYNLNLTASNSFIQGVSIPFKIYTNSEESKQWILFIVFIAIPSFLSIIVILGSCAYQKMIKQRRLKSFCEKMSGIKDKLIDQPVQQQQKI